MHFYRQVEPIFDMVKVALCLPAWKTVVKALGPVLDVLHRPFDNAFLKRGMDMVFWFQEPAAGLRIPCASIR
jgi:hypothetical protein